MKVNGPHANVVCWGMVLREIVGEVAIAAVPIDAKLALVDSVPNPVETHVDCS